MTISSVSQQFHFPDPEYRRVHRQLKSRRGLASEYNCVDCHKPAREWTWNKQIGDQLILDSYEPRCSSCHKQMDRALLNKDDVVAIKNLYSLGQHSHSQIAKIYSVSSKTISAILAGTKWKNVK